MINLRLIIAEKIDEQTSSLETLKRDCRVVSVRASKQMQKAVKFLKKAQKILFTPGAK